jgi:hypothetical protein
VGPQARFSTGAKLPDAESAKTVDAPGMEQARHLPDHPLTYGELAALGFSDWQIRKLLDVGELRRPTKGVYVPAHLNDTLYLRAACLAKVVAPHQIVVDRSAAWLHGIDTLGYAEHDVLPPVETCSIRGSTRAKRNGVRGMERDLLPRDLTMLGAIKVTTPLRTAMDLGCHLHRREATAALNQFAARYGVTSDMIAQELPRFRGRRGVVQLRLLASRIEARVESPRESWTLDAIDEEGLPRPEVQYWVEWEGERMFRLDFAYPKHRVCLEYDGFEFHQQTAEQRAHDTWRRNWLRDHGWTVIVVQAGDFSGLALDRWLRQLQDALGTAYTTRRW